ncbi:MAG: DUF2029 domain-containing protein [Anaerolineae bacterium]|nr:DUF2029 domain-containing protein [Anaerolineae bacterium]
MKLSYELRILGVFLILCVVYLLIALLVYAPLGHYGTLTQSTFSDPWIDRVNTILSGGLLYQDVYTTTPPLINFLLIPPVLLSGLFGHRNPWGTLSFMVYFSLFNLLAAYVLLCMSEDRREGYRSALYYLLNPFTFGNSLLRRQDESILAFFFALALLFVLHQRHWRANIVIGLTLLVKLTGVLMMPIALVHTRDWKYVVIPVVIFALVFAPFLIRAGESAVFWDISQKRTQHPFNFEGISLGRLWLGAFGEPLISLEVHSVVLVIGVILVLALIVWKPQGVLEDLALLLSTIWLLSPRLHAGYFSLLVLAMAPLVRKYRLKVLYFAFAPFILIADLCKANPLKDFTVALILMAVGFALLVAAMVRMRLQRKRGEAESGRATRSPDLGWTTVAYWAVWAVVVVLYLVWPLAHLDAYHWTNDEGLYMQRAALANAGYPLYAEIALNKPPLLVWILQVAFWIAGPTMAVARLTALCLTLVGLVATGLVAGQLWGKWAGLVAAGVLLALPETLLRAHVVMPDLPALACALVAMGAALLFRRGGRRGWMLLSGAAFAGALLIHPVLIYAALPLAVIPLWPVDKSWRRIAWFDVLIFLGTAAVAGLLVLAAVDRRAFFHWVFQFNYGAGADLLSPQLNWERLTGYLGDNLPLLGLSVISLIALSTVPGKRRGLLVVTVWWFAIVAILMASSPLQKQYLIFLAFPLAILVGGGLATMGRWTFGYFRGEYRPTWWGAVLALLALVGLVLFALARWEETKPYLAVGPEWSSDDLSARAFLEEIPPGEFVATDDPMLAFAAGQLVPPPLTELSTKQIKVGNMKTEDARGSILWYGTRAALFSTGRLERLPGLEDWVASVATERRDFGELRAYRLDLPRSNPHLAESQFGSQIKLRGHALSSNELRPGDTLSVALLWECDGAVPEDYHVFVHLADEENHLWGQHDGAPGMGERPTSQWAVGQRVFDTHPIEIDQDAPPGKYRLFVGLYSWPSLERLPAFLPDGSRWPDDRVLLGDVLVVLP